MQLCALYDMQRSTMCNMQGYSMQEYSIACMICRAVHDVRYAGNAVCTEWHLMQLYALYDICTAVHDVQYAGNMQGICREYAVQNVQYAGVFNARVCSV